MIIRPDLYIAWSGNEIPTLLHKEDVNEGAKVLMKVITGAANLPNEWQKNRKSERSWLWWIPIVASLAVGGAAVSIPLLKQYKWIA